METNKVEISEYGSLLMYKIGYSSNFIFNTIKANRLSGLSIFTDPMEEPPKNLDFLVECSFLEELSITSCVDYEFSFLKRLPHLKRISIQINGKTPIDFSSQIKLEELTINWRKTIIGIDKCKKLEQLCLVDFKAHDFSFFAMSMALKVIKVKTGSIKNLNGLQGLHYLTHINLGNCRNLLSIAAINNLTLLKHLEIESCAKISDYEALTYLPKLQEIEIINCKKIKSIEFIRKFPLLKSLAIVGNTEILDGNIEPALKLDEFFYSKGKMQRAKN